MSKTLIAGLIASLTLAACAIKPELRSSVTGDLAPCGSAPHCVSSQETRKDFSIPPMKYVGSAVAARDKLARVLGRMQSLGYAVVLNEGDYLRATYTTGTVGFVDDLEFVFSQREIGVIHIRSSSRVGYADFGANRAHLEAVRNAFVVAKN